MNDTAATFALLKRHGIGFDFTRFDTGQNNGNFPPHNIEQTGENSFRLTLAVAGFKPDELHVTVDDSTLHIVGKREKAESDEDFMHKGIAFRDFAREFKLMEYIEVVSGRLAHGLLIIDLERQLPESKKPRRIAIAA